MIPRDFRVADTRKARVILIEAGPRLLPALHPDSSAEALKQLHDLHVEVLVGKPVTAVYEDGVEAGGERLYSYNVIWAAGVKAAPILATLGTEMGPGGRVKVLPDCSVPGQPNVFVIGDAAFLIDWKTNKQVPGVSQGALQMGRYVARVIQQDISSNDPAQRGKLRAEGFHYKDFGSMATIGKSQGGGGDGAAALWRLPGLVCVARSAHHGADRLPQPGVRAAVLDLQLFLLWARVAPDHELQLRADGGAER